MSLRPLVAIVFVRPLASVERAKGKPVGGITQQLVTRITKLYKTALAALYCHRHRTGLGLKVAKRNPSTLSIAQLSPKHGYGGSTLAAGQRLGQISCRRRGEKTLNLLAIAIHRFTQSFKLTHQHREQLRLGSHHMLGNLQLRFIELFPQLLTALLTEMMLARGKAVPFSAAKIRQGLGVGYFVRKVQGNLRFQISKHLQGPWIVLFKGAIEQIAYTRFMAPQTGGDPE